MMVRVKYKMENQLVTAHLDSEVVIVIKKLLKVQIVKSLNILTIIFFMLHLRNLTLLNKFTYQTQSQIARIKAPIVKSNCIWEIIATMEINKYKLFSTKIARNLVDCVSTFIISSMVKYFNN